MITLCLNIFADLVSLRSISIAFPNLGNIADGKFSKFLFKARSNLYDFVLFGSLERVNFKLNPSYFQKRFEIQKFLTLVMDFENFKFNIVKNQIDIELNPKICLYSLKDKKKTDHLF